MTLTGLVDVVAALVVAVVVFRQFGAVSGDDSNPPVCSNTAGNVVSCGLTPTVLMLPTFLVVLTMLVAWQIRRGPVVRHSAANRSRGDGRREGT